MATIDKFDLGIYFEYARRTEYVESIQDQYRLKEASSIPPQTAVIDILPRPSEIEVLIGKAYGYAPWAFFLPPKKFRFQRRSPFARHRVAPSLGSLEKHEADMAKLESIEVEGEEEQREKDVLTNLFNRIEQINKMLGFIVGRIGQFLQG